jgi:hypothetical protein
LSQEIAYRAMVVLGLFGAKWVAPASSTYVFSDAASSEL